MWETGCAWQTAYEFVKSKRLSCAPNTTFSCNLIEIGRLMEETQPACRLFRCARHLPHDRETILLKICRSPISRQLIPASLSLLSSSGVYVLLFTSPPSEIDPVVKSHLDSISSIYVWCGKDSSNESLEATRERILDLQLLFRTSHLITPIIVKEGSEDPSLLSLIAALPPPESDNPVETLPITYPDLYVGPNDEFESLPSPRSTPSVLSSRLPALSIEINPSLDYSDANRPKSTSTPKATPPPLNFSLFFSNSNQILNSKPASQPSSARSLINLATVPSEPGGETLSLEITSPLNTHRSTSSAFPPQLDSFPLIESEIEEDQDETQATRCEKRPALAISPTASETHAKPRLFQAISSEDESPPMWVDIGMYDEDDLIESEAYLLVNPASPHYLWVGSTFQPQLSGSSQQDSESSDLSLKKWALGLAANTESEAIHSVDFETELKIQEQGNEDEEFWDVFSSGC